MSASVSKRKRRVVLTVPAMAFIAVAVGASSFAFADTINWQRSKLPTLDGEDPQLRSVTASEDGDIWSVGSIGPKGSRTGVALHYGNGSWTQTDTPQGVWLEDAAAINAKHALAVGGDSAGPKALEWNGQSWTKQSVAMPDNGDSASSLTDVDAVSATDAWAVGNTGAVGVPDGTAFLEHWDGHEWQLEDFEVPERVKEFSLSSVEANASDDVWAVGTGYVDGVGQPLALHWDGSKVVVTSPVDKTEPGEFSDVAVVNGEVWTTGFVPGTDATKARALLAKWDGKNWKRISTPDDDVWLYGLDSDGKDGILATGYTADGGALLHWDGKTASLESSPVDDDESVQDVYTSPDGSTSWVTGVDGSSAPYLAHTA